MKLRWINNLVLLLIATLLGLGFCEVVARLITKTNEDGQAYYGKRPLLPYHFPAEMVRKKMEHYFNRQSEAYVVDDPILGWTVGPNRTNIEGMYRSNSAGIRSRPNEYSLSPPKGVLRIALFGDSFTHGDEEPFEKTWGKFLEDDLINAGISAEVLNFGVPGYGIGQAYLRWKYQGKKYSPRIVVFGFQPENIKRTVNIFRSLYSRNTWLVFSKPRFFINKEGKLELVNSPVIPPQEVADVLKDLSRSPLAAHEYWYAPDNYRQSFWLKSRFISLLYTFFNEYKPHPGGRYDHRPGRHYWDPEGEPMRTSLLILKTFAREAQAEGEIPIILHIPKKNDLKYLEKGTRPAHYQVLDELKKSGVMVVDPAPEMQGESRLYKHSHYSSRGGRIVARVLADAITGLINKNLFNDSFKGQIPARDQPDPADLLTDSYREGEDLLIDVGTDKDKLFVKNGFYHREKYLHQTPVRWRSE
ncbi:MAG TPA: SGNH/GDSL hydrolase family protein, partial [Proteobacteria bacterium]|nr:SGNH/GDSL hydrolase family protein [Pseudomonadota bacterium]